MDRHPKVGVPAGNLDFHLLRKLRRLEAPLSRAPQPTTHLAVFMAKAMTVHEAATRLGVPVSHVYSWLRNHGEPRPPSVSSYLDARLVRRLLGPELMAALVDEEALPPPPPRVTSQDLALQHAAALFGRPIKSLKPAPRERPRRGVEPGRQRTDWDWYLIDPESRRQWVDAGIADHDARSAACFAQAGLGPDDLDKRVKGERLIERYWAGQPATSIVALVKAARTRQRRQRDTA